MALKRAVVTIVALIEFDDTKFDLDDVDGSVVVCFRKEDKYTDEELFLPKMDGMEVIDYIDVGVGESEE
jgi:hypothetical protein